VTAPPAHDGVGGVAAGVAGGTRPELLVVLAGTGTEVGKTWVGCRLVRELRDAGRTVAARKPVQSFDPSDAVTDADLLAEASGEEPLVVCPAHRRYEVAMAPPMAAEVLGRPMIRMAELLDELAASWSVPPPSQDPSRGSVGVVELAGGVRSPVAHDGDGVELIAGLAPDLVVVVADAGLGTINAVRTTLDALAGLDAPVVVHLNRFDPDDDLHRRNRAWLAEHLRPGDEGILLRSDLGTLVATISEARFRGAAT
jgi:dethiobiotin synthetase